MENKSRLIGRLNVMKQYTPNEISRSYLQQAIEALSSERGAELTDLDELEAALDMLSYKLCRREAEVLRDVVEYLEALKGDTGNE